MSVVRLMIEKEIDKLDRGIENAGKAVRELEQELTATKSQIKKMEDTKAQFILDLEKLNG